MRYILALIATVLLSSTISATANAQVPINLNFNVDKQPVWGPTGYDHVEYYYLPDIDVYYFVPKHKYYYFNRGQWRSTSSLPSRYRGFNLYKSYKVVVNEPTPYRDAIMYREKYASYKGRYDQESIRDSRDSKYFVNPKHPEHKNWIKQNKHGKSNGRGKGNK